MCNFPQQNKTLGTVSEDIKTAKSDFTQCTAQKFAFSESLLKLPSMDKSKETARFKNTVQIFKGVNM